MDGVDDATRWVRLTHTWCGRRRDADVRSTDRSEGGSPSAMSPGGGRGRGPQRSGDVRAHADGGRDGGYGGYRGGRGAGGGDGGGDGRRLHGARGAGGYDGRGRGRGRGPMGDGFNSDGSPARQHLRADNPEGGGEESVSVPPGLGVSTDVSSPSSMARWGKKTPDCNHTAGALAAVRVCQPA
jgi:hypothetical protein